GQVERLHWAGGTAKDQGRRPEAQARGNRNFRLDDWVQHHEMARGAARKADRARDVGHLLTATQEKQRLRDRAERTRRPRKRVDRPASGWSANRGHCEETLHRSREGNSEVVGLAHTGTASPRSAVARR